MLPLLTTKLFPPLQRGTSIERTRLEAMLDAGEDRPLILVTAPAGFGKTTLVTSWLAGKDVTVAWVSLDENDNDTQLFLAYIVEALVRSQDGDCDSATSVLQSSDPPPPTAILTYLINDLACLQAPGILVLDDYHLIKSDEVHALVSFLIDNVPPTFQILVLSRHQIGISVPRLRASNSVLEVSAYDIRFNQEETGQFLRDVMRLDLDEATVAELWERTEGWVTGLQLAALGMQSAAGSDFVHELHGDDRFIADYLIDEVLTHQSESMRRFLIRTSLLNRLSAPLCNAMLDIGNAQELLANLENLNLFLIPLDNRRSWYRYHHLFGEMLRSRLYNEFPEEIPDLYDRIIKWQVQNGNTEEAIDYAIDNQDYARAAELLESVINEMGRSGVRHHIIAWAEKLPLPLLRANETIWSQYILALFFYGDFQKAFTLLKSKEGGSAGDQLQITDTLLAALMLHMTLDAPCTRLTNRQILSDFPDGSPLLRGIAMGHLGSSSLLLGDLPTAERNLKDAVRQIDSQNSPAVSFVFSDYCSDLALVRGNLNRAFISLRDSILDAHRHQLQKGVTFSKTLITFGLLHYEWNDLAEAEKLLQEGIAQAEMSGQVDRRLYAIRARLQLPSVTGEVADIAPWLDAVDAIAAELSYPPLLMDRIGAYRCLLAMNERRTDDAVAWAAAFAQRSDTEISCLQQTEWLTAARAFLATGEPALAIPILNQLEALAIEQGRKRDQIEIAVLLTRALYERGDKSAARQHLMTVLPLAEVEGFIRTFVDEGQSIFDLLTDLAKSSNGAAKGAITASYIRRLRRAFPASVREQDQSDMKLLTPREYTILGLLAEGLTYSQIQEQLSITENTLKTHIKNIYGKLQVHNRTNAILAAQRAGIL